MRSEIELNNTRAILQEKIKKSFGWSISEMEMVAKCIDELIFAKIKRLTEVHLDHLDGESLFYIKSGILKGDAKRVQPQEVVPVARGENEAKAGKSKPVGKASTR